ncbi:hypothetical protein SRM1_02609 [Pseudomonas fluorescens]|nr:hypothetical protein SRM1_02609 [Pseudomonas fluorescens]
MKDVTSSSERPDVRMTEWQNCEDGSWVCSLYRLKILWVSWMRSIAGGERGFSVWPVCLLSLVGRCAEN